MPISITTRNSGVSAADKQYAEQKAGKVLRIFRGIARVEVILAGEGLKHRAELIVSLVRGDPIAVHADHEQLRAAIDLVVDKASLQLTRHKDKLRDHRAAEAPAAGATPGAESAATGPDDDLDSYQDVVDRTEFGP